MKTVKKAFKNWATTIFGLVLWALVVAGFICKSLELINSTYLELALVAVLGWLFVKGKDSMLQIITFGLLKIKDK